MASLPVYDQITERILLEFTKHSERGTNELFRATGGDKQALKKRLRMLERVGIIDREKVGRQQINNTLTSTGQYVIDVIDEINDFEVKYEEFVKSIQNLYQSLGPTEIKNRMKSIHRKNLEALVQKGYIRKERVSGHWGVVEDVLLDPKSKLLEMVCESLLCAIQIFLCKSLFMLPISVPNKTARQIIFSYASGKIGEMVRVASSLNQELKLKYSVSQLLGESMLLERLGSHDLAGIKSYWRKVGIGKELDVVVDSIKTMSRFKL